MKKSLTALAVLGAFAGSAMAADVTMYGVIDTGLAYTHEKATAEGDELWKNDEFRMDSGNNSGSRWGLKGTEELGNGLTVGFKLEGGFSGDSGKLSEEGKLFNRESTLSVAGDFGTFYAGRMGTLVSDTGSVGFYGAMASAFGTGWSDNIAGHADVMADFTTRYDNTIAYVSPDFAGAKFYAQYAMGDSNENTHKGDRYAALGAEWKGGPLHLGFLVDMLDKGVEGTNEYHSDMNVEDTYTVNVAGSYDCGFATTFLAVQYFKDARDAGTVVATSYYKAVEEEEGENGLRFAKGAVANTGYGLHVSTAFDALGGAWKVGVGYMDAEVDYAHDGKVADTKAYTASIGYEYALSKRTKLYSGAGYVKREADVNYFGEKGSFEQEAFDVVAGLVHTF